MSAEAKRPYLKPRFWNWKDQARNETPGVGLFRGSALAAHMTPAEARTIADRLHDMADHLEGAAPTTTAKDASK